MERKSLNELKRNTLIIAISTIGSKAISFILAPLYSFYMTTSQYGVMDLITTTAGLLLPFICFDIYEGAFRYASEKEYDEKTVFTTSLSLCFIETTVVALITFILSRFINVSLMVSISIVSAILDAYLTTLSWYARGRGKMMTFALSGVLNSVILLALNFVFLINLRQGLNGWIISFLGAKIVVVIYLLISLKTWKIFSISKIDKAFTKEVLRYCLPLIPSTGFWWVMNVSDRYVISYFIGTEANGIYAVGNKLPAILSVFENIFYQSWQTTAFKSANSADRDKIFSEVFYNYLRFLTIGVLAILVVLKPMILYLFAKEYSSAWVCAAVLVIAVMLHALAGNLGTLYSVFKSTGGALKTSAIGAIVNTVLNIIFVPMFGFNAAAWTTVVGYVAVLIVRWRDVSKYVKLSLPKKNTVIVITLLAVSLVLYYVPGIISYIGRGAIFVAYAYINRSMILKLLKR